MAYITDILEGLNRDVSIHTHNGRILQLRLKLSHPFRSNGGMDVHICQAVDYFTAAVEDNTVHGSRERGGEVNTRETHSDIFQTTP
jgi:hypothetical protein